MCFLRGLRRALSATKFPEEPPPGGSSLSEGRADFVLLHDARLEVRSWRGPRLAPSAQPGQAKSRRFPNPRALSPLKAPYR